jgi:hypothetical protein
MHLQIETSYALTTPRPDRHRLDILPFGPSPLLNSLDEMNAWLAFPLQDTQRCEGHGHPPGACR